MARVVDLAASGT